MTTRTQSNSTKVTTPKEREIRIERTFNAPRERVWRALTDSQLVARWWGRGNELRVEKLELVPGGHWRFVEYASDGVHGFEGRYREVSRPERLVQTFEWDGMPGHVAVETMTLEDLGDGRTKLRTVSLFHTDEERDGMLKSGMEQGLDQSYAALDRLLTEEDARRNKVTPFLMFNDQLEAAIEFYTVTFPGSKVVSVTRAPDGRVSSAEFVVGGQTFMGFNGGPHFAFSEGVSLFVSCDDQKEVDLYWGRLLKGGATPSRCGWITDRFGLSWQIVPKRLAELLGDKNAKKVQAVVAAMMEMVKLEVATLEKAYAAA